MKRFAPLILLLAIFGAAFAQGGPKGPGEREEQKDEHDNSIVSVFVQPGISFITFNDRDKFQEATDSVYKSLMAEATTDEESTAVSRQTFQKVNLALPVTAGIQAQIFEDHFLSAGIGFIYDNESIVLTDRRSKTHNYSYTLQAVPLYLEYRFAIPNSLITLSGESLFSVSARWYWMLPGTEIYSSWGKISAKPEPLGSGFGFSFGYLIGTWKSLRIYGDLGYTKISVESRKSFADVVPLYDEPDEDGESEATKKASWDLGGLQLQIRVSFGLWNKPKPVPEPKANDGTSPEVTLPEEGASRGDDVITPRDSGPQAPGEPPPPPQNGEAPPPPPEALQEAE